jgi:hypothetical protein
MVEGERKDIKWWNMFRDARRAVRTASLRRASLLKAVFPDNQDGLFLERQTFLGETPVQMQ